MEPITVALIGAAAGLATVFAGNWANKRLGLGQPIEEKINGRLKVLNDALEEEVVMRKQAEEECRTMLAEAVQALEEEQAVRAQERDEMNRRLDDLEATKLRLLNRLGMTVDKDNTMEAARAERDRLGG